MQTLLTFNSDAASAGSTSDHLISWLVSIFWMSRTWRAFDPARRNISWSELHWKLVTYILNRFNQTCWMRSNNGLSLTRWSSFDVHAPNILLVLRSFSVALDSFLSFLIKQSIKTLMRLVLYIKLWFSDLCFVCSMVVAGWQ